MEQKRFMLLINLILLQILSILLVTGLTFFRNLKLGIFKFHDSDTYYTIMLIVVIIVSCLTIYLIKELFYLQKRDLEAKLSKQKLIDSQEMIQTLKANQHDFINHLSVISLAAQMGDTNLINTYTKKVVKQVRELDVLTKLNYPELAALIYSKLAEAEEFEIKVHININTTLQGIKVATTDLVRLLGNLLNNAIDALKEVAIEERDLNIVICENEEKFKFAVCNIRPIIPHDVMSNLFRQGFTTKGDKGNGFGLFNVQNIVKKYRGEINVTSDLNSGTVFEICIPKV